MTRFRALIAANVVVGIFAFALIATEWRDDDRSLGITDWSGADMLAVMKAQSTYAGTLPRITTSRAAPVSPVTPPEVEVSLDPAGRPYDVALRRGATVERRHLATIRAPSRRVAFMGGENVPYPYGPDSRTIVLAERPGRLYPVDAIWLHERSVSDGIVGVVVVERDTPIARWRTLLETAYGTDAGLGAITTHEWLKTPAGAGGDMLARRLDKWPTRSQFFSADADGYPGVDTVVFANGFGDGGFPAVAGYDASGARAAVVLWTIVVPWRLAFPRGEPPRRVTQRENALAACLAGRRTIGGAHCRLAPSG